ncbi:hypothetical protein E1B28_009042 [Marasmius oreades]|uniref:Protein-S-isoprenylcysteine O-methyltransferase n=1 Tax=Marasmius oreades TaxID=181124 RepID=A0A9P7RZT1_9AGAR|nr:uncharacterized protein E1B28_009042 [Marasmius oreades]KAG7092712.1 hypothetical protein E1B28_009042 [Marasmius oreades]
MQICTGGVVDGGLRLWYPKKIRKLFPTPLSSMQAVLKIALFILSAVAFGTAYKPPHTKPAKAESQKSAPRNAREWAVGFRIKYVLPLQRAAYYFATANECLHILLTLNATTRDSIPSISPMFLLGAFLSCLGGFIRFWCYRELGECFTYELVPVGQHATDDSVVKHPKLITTGPYNYIRHPSYLGSWICFSGSVMCLLVRGSWIRESGFLNTVLGKLAVGSWISAVGQGVLLVTMRINDEDELIKKQFGEQWNRWCKKVQYRMIPGVF